MVFGKEFLLGEEFRDLYPPSLFSGYCPFRFGLGWRPVQAELCVFFLFRGYSLS
jgi:hypothetical protein